MLPTGNQGNSVGAGQLRYPNVAYESDSDYVLFSFYNYQAPFSKQGIAAAGGNVFGGGLSGYNASSSSGLTSSGTSIILYMPEDVEVQYGASWQDTNLTNIAKGALAGFGGAADEDLGASIGNMVSAATVATDNFLTQGTSVANAISSALSAANFGSLTVNDIFAASTGQILNPNTEVLYKGPKMRNFSLTFKMAPKDTTEAGKIKQILTTFKKSILPGYGGAGDAKKQSFVKVPKIVDVTFMNGGRPSPWVTQFKPSVITDLDISYTPDGAWATYRDGSPVATKITIRFQETKMVYADEIKDNGGSY